MRKEISPARGLVLAIGLFVLFVVYTLLLERVDVRPIGPNGSAVGFAALNGWVHGLFGVHWVLYTVTDWLGLVPLLVALGFAVLGLVQLLKRKSLLRVDGSILVLGGFYVLVMAAYVFFETHTVNYRPVLIDGYLETSYPSSTTMLVMCVMPTAMMQLCRLCKRRALRLTLNAGFAVFTVFMVVGRLVCGVHWFTDILGGALLSAALVVLYCAATAYIRSFPARG